MTREWLLHLQSTLNDAHLQLTDAVAVRDDGWRNDELLALDAIDAAIMEVEGMRLTDVRDERRLRISYTKATVGYDD